MIKPWYTSRFEGQDLFSLSDSFNSTLEEVEYKLAELASIKDALIGAVQSKLRELEEKEDELDGKISYYDELIEEYE